MINKSNYEAFALDYLEGNLSATDRQAMEDFLAKHPAIAEEVTMLAEMITVVPDESIVFENKAALLKQEAGARVVAMHRRTWFRMAVAAAAMLFLVGGYLSGYFTEDAGMNEDFVIDTPVKETNDIENIKPLKEEKEEVVVVDEEIIEETEVVLNKKIQEKDTPKKATTPQLKPTRKYNDIANTSLPKTNNTPIKKPELDAPNLEENTPEKEDESAVAIKENESIVPEEMPQPQLSPKEETKTPAPEKEAVVSNEKPQQETTIEIEVDIVEPIALAENSKNQETTDDERKGKKKLRKISRFLGKLPFEGATASIIPTYYTDKKKESK